MELNDAVQLLRGAGYQVKEPPLPIPIHSCIRCDNNDEFERLVDITVITSVGEEGHAEVTRYVCDDHLVDILELLVDLGFSDHRHGGINFLEDSECPGYADMHKCPTPAPEDE